MKRFVTLLLVVSTLALPGTAVGSELKPVSDFEGGKLYTVGKVNVVELRGSYRQMGRQYGQLLKNVLRKAYDATIVDKFSKKMRIDPALMKSIVDGIFAFYPERYRTILYGMAETSGMTLDQLKALEQVVILGRIFKNAGYGCSGIAAWGPYTGKKPLVFGRNFDWHGYYKEFAEFVTLVVYNPNDGSVPLASINYAGQIQTLTGMNKAGLFLEFNNGTVSGGEVDYPGRIWPLMLATDWLLSSSTIEQLEANIVTARAFNPFIINVADKNSAVSFEWATFDVKRREQDKPGLLVATNHFVNPTWGIAPLFVDNATKTLLRRENLLALGEKYKGRFNVDAMKKVLDAHIEDNGGGATQKDGTVYQVVAVPSQLKLWLKMPGYVDWTELDLNQLFR